MSAGAWTGETQDDVLERERQRLERNVKVIPSNTPVKHLDTVWHVTLSGLPTDKGLPVELAIGTTTVFKSSDNGADVQTTIDHDLGGYGQTNEFHLSIPVMDFKTSRKFNMEQGNRIVALLSSAFEISLASLGLTDRDVKFAFTEKGLAINQQTSPF